ncbi:MAG: hypothetical protein U0289_15750 [Cyclobacteriaceae bacterium]|nr:hypothetical protein [Cytophagales bacterium]HNP77657.1 hypothetical protein [Cyclobacteriaceae bacterium]
MNSTVRITSVFSCSLERAFKTPMLCDVSKVHTGYGIMPKVTHCTEDETWGQPGGSKKIFAAPSLTQKGGYASMDKVIERIENKYWKIEVSDFQAWILGFSKFTGEWQTTEFGTNKILIRYTYTMHSDQWILFPVQWLFTKLLWRVYMRHVLENVRQLAYQEEPYMYPGTFGANAFPADSAD